MTIRDRKFMPQRPLELDLSGENGNAFFLIGHASALAEQLDLDGPTIIEEMKAGDYENLLAVFDYYFGDYVTLYR